MHTSCTLPGITGDKPGRHQPPTSDRSIDTQWLKRSILRLFPASILPYQQNPVRVAIKIDLHATNRHRLIDTGQCTRDRHATPVNVRCGGGGDSGGRPVTGAKCGYDKQQNLRRCDDSVLPITGTGDQGGSDHLETVHRMFSHLFLVDRRLGRK